MRSNGPLANKEVAIGGHGWPWVARSSGVAESGRLVRRMSHRVDPAAIAEEARAVRLDAVLRPSRRGPCNDPHGQPGDLPVPEQKDSAHARFYDDAGSASVSRYRRTPCRLLKDGGHRHPEVGFRRSMAGLRTPLSTLRIDPRGPLRMTRGRCGSLNLHRKGLAPSTSCRSPGAPVHPIRPIGADPRAVNARRHGRPGLVQSRSVWFHIRPFVRRR